jgi:hypothetical protein
VPFHKFKPEAPLAPNENVPSDHCPLVMAFKFVTSEFVREGACNRCKCFITQLNSLFFRANSCGAWAQRVKRRLGRYQPAAVLLPLARLACLKESLRKKRFCKRHQVLLCHHKIFFISSASPRTRSRSLTACFRRLLGGMER